MAGLPDRTASLPAAEMPEVTGRVRPARAYEVPRTLVVALTPVVDSIRQLYTTMGLRTYRVFLVHQVWSGERRGAGVANVISRREILPTPRILDMSATSEVLHATGLSEEGGLSIDQISVKYSEDDLLGRTMDIQDPTLQRTGLANVEFYWEVVEQRVTSPAPAHRRYVPNAVPSLSRDGFQWKASLTKQDFDTGRQGGMQPRSTF